MGFMVSVDGQKAPKFVHATIEGAVDEALRIQQLSIEQRSWCQQIRIVEEIMILPAVHSNGLMDIERFRVINRAVAIKVDTMLKIFGRCFRK